MFKSVNKYYKECVKYYLQHIDDADYVEYIESSTAEGLEITKKYVEEKKPSWHNRVDFYGLNGDEAIAEIVFADILSNEDVAKLLSKIYGLSEKKYEKEILYKKPTLLHKYDYVHLRHQGYSVGSFADIKFKDDKYIHDVHISWSQMNSYYAYMEYSFHFKKCFDQKRYDSFIKERIKLVKPKKDYSFYYRVSKKKEDNYLILDQMNRDFFRIICQHYITSLLYSKDGKRNKLINMVVMTREKPININQLYMSDFGMGYYNKENNFVITTDHNEIDYTLYAGNNRIPNFSLAGYVGKYGNDFYLSFFGRREVEIFEKEYSKYISGRKKIKYNKEFTQFLRKIQSLSDAETRTMNKFYDEFNAKWEFYLANDKDKIKAIHKKYRIDIRKIYQSSYEYMRLATEIDYAKTNKIIAILALIISVIAILVSI